MEKHENIKIYLLMVLAALFWSGAFIAGKFAIPYIPTCTLTFLRFLFAAGILSYALRYENKKNPENAFKFNAKKHMKIFLFTGIVGILGYHVLFFTSLKYTSAINSSIIGATNPILTILITAVFVGDKIPRMQLFGILLSFIGVVLTITGADFSILASFSFNKGDFIMLAAALCWAAYGVFSKSKGVGISPIALTYYSFLFCCIFIFPLVLLEKPWTIYYIPIEAVIAVIYMSICPSVIGYLVQQMSIKKIGATRTSIFVNLVPVFSIILAVLILKEELVPIKLVTALLIIAGVCICQLTSEHSKRKQ